jgi:hypothetical protein
MAFHFYTMGQKNKRIAWISKATLTFLGYFKWEKNYPSVRVPTNRNDAPRVWYVRTRTTGQKQELNFSHLICRNTNGIKVIMYTTLILSTLLTAYKKLNNLKGYKIPKLSFALEMEEQLIKYIIELYGGNPNQPPKNKNSFWNTT